MRGTSSTTPWWERPSSAGRPAVREVRPSRPHPMGGGGDGRPPDSPGTRTGTTLSVERGVIGIVNARTEMGTDGNRPCGLKRGRNPNLIKLWRSRPEAPTETRVRRRLPTMIRIGRTCSRRRRRRSARIAGGQQGAQRWPDGVAEVGRGPAQATPSRRRSAGRAAPTMANWQRPPGAGREPGDADQGRRHGRPDGTATHSTTQPIRLASRRRRPRTGRRTSRRRRYRRSPEPVPGGRRSGRARGSGRGPDQVQRQVDPGQPAGRVHHLPQQQHPHPAGQIPQPPPHADHPSPPILAVSSRKPYGNPDVGEPRRSRSIGVQRGHSSKRR